MKHLLILISFFSLTAFAAPKHSVHKHAVHAKAQTYVYVCNSSRAYAYHIDPNCSGLNRCTHGISKITLEEAQQMGRTPCRICTR